MRLTKYAHSCLRVEHDGGVLVVDPGVFSDPAALDGADAVLMLSYSYWQTTFGGDPLAIGKVLEMNDRPHTIVGVLPRVPPSATRPRRCDPWRRVSRSSPPGWRSAPTAGGTR